MTLKALVLGSVNIDDVFTVPHIVEPGQTISSLSYQRKAGGKGANCAVAIAKAGTTVDFAGHVGQDGLWLRETLEGYGVETRHLKTVETPTGRASIQVDAQSGENCIVTSGGANFEKPSALPDVSTLSTYALLVIQNEIPLDFSIDGLVQAKKAGLTTLFNPSPVTNLADSNVPWHLVDWLVLNEGELGTLAKTESSSDSAQSVEAQVAALRSRLNLDANVVITLGKQGVWASGKGAQWTITQGPGRLVGKVLDTTGAGDTFTGYLASAICQHTNQPFPEQKVNQAMAVAQQAAAMCVEVEGAMNSIPVSAEVEKRIQTA